MKKIINNNKYFLATLCFFLVFVFVYKIEHLEKQPSVNKKEVVNVFLRENEITKGLPNLVKKFNEEHDDIFIKLEFSGADYNNIALIKLVNEKNVDIIEFMGKSLIEKNLLNTLDDININYSNLEDGDLIKLNDDVYSVKYGSSATKLMYNDELLIQCGLDPNDKPKTLDELIILLEEIKSANPNLIPLDITIANIHDLFSILGNMASSEDSIYSTFWDYKDGEYDYRALSEVLKRFKYMYDNELISNDFIEKTESSVLDNFEESKSVITFAQTSKKHSIMDRTYNLDVSFSNIPLMSDNNKYYYYTKQRNLAIAKNVIHEEKLDDKGIERLRNHEKAVKEVFEWLISDEVTDYLTIKDANYAAFGDNPFNGDRLYDEINNDEGFYKNTLDPTEILAANATLVQDTVFACIRGEVDIDEAVEKLTKDINEFVSTNERNEDIDLSKYKE